VQSESAPPQQQKYAKPPKEIERKFIIDPTSSTFAREVLAGKSLDDFDHTTLRQGYLAIRDDGGEERIRSFGDMYFERTMKSGGDLVREEENTPLSCENFAALWPRTAGARVEKTRYQIPYQGVVLELDIYHGQLAGLCVGEVEFSGEDETAARAAADAFGTPAWAKHDVTTDERFKNKRLATSSTIPVFYEQ
jgi:adenylate cyclase